MKVVFVCSAFESIGIESLSAFVKQAGHETDLVFDPQLFDNVFMKRPRLARMFSDRRQVLEQIEAARPDLLAFSVTGFDLPWCYDIATEAKRRRPVPVVFGGAHAWICPDQIMENPVVDFLVQAEGEEPLAEILNRLQIGDQASPIRNTWRRFEGTIIKGEVIAPSVGPDDLPFPDKDLFYRKMNHLYGYTVTTGRICTRGCAYCFYNVVHKLPYARILHRRRSVENVLAELEQALPRYRNHSVRFYDNNFVESRPWLSSFADEYSRRIRVPYHAQANPDSLIPETIEDLRRSGCFEMQVGVQTLNPYTRKAILRSETEERIGEVVDDMAKAGIRCCIDLIMGLPGENEGDALTAARFFNRHRPKKINLFWLDYLPGSDISRLAHRQGLLSDADLESIDRGEWMAGLFGGGETLIRNRNMLRAQMLLTLLPVLPPSQFEKILRRNLFRFFPVIFAPNLLWIFISSLVQHPRDMHRRRYFGLHREFLPKVIKRRLSDLATWFTKRV